MYHYDILEYPNVTQVDLRGHWRSLQVNQIEIRPCYGNAPKDTFITSQIYETENLWMDIFLKILSVISKTLKKYPNSLNLTCI